MKDEDLCRRLEKLAALRDHPSTLPAVRESARRAHERLRGFTPTDTPGRFRRREWEEDPLMRHIMKELNRQTAMHKFPWHFNRPLRSD